jgi:hypothetical protein
MDAGFKSAPYPGYTTHELKAALVTNPDNTRMATEITRRAKRDAGDWSVMTDGERLHRAQTTGRTAAGNNIC